MSNWQFMFLFPEERELLEGVITGVRKEVGLEKPEDLLKDYQSRFGNLQETMRQLQEAHPEQVRTVLRTITTNYNASVDRAVSEFPLTVDAYWQTYRRDQSKSSLIHRLSKDVEMANFYKNFVTEMFKCDGGIPLDVEPSYVLLDRQPERALGMGVYVFKNGNGHPTESTWDLRQKEIPRFQTSASK